ncbi:MAG: bifunctional aminotransferase class I/II-fold pyridoxal phosphate-dependent enzyme/GNAT family N-acetyltransferase [Imperialibacter sp.]|uniref:bifunctional aminotransferase class I/II-fold pyridoxal phosphate-dependent enzyme/GNAT family N-acetyltransferase n=1 Tax=Imperialibacter sp. TaxID=2038411 RepID=UPI0032EB2D78
MAKTRHNHLLDTIDDIITSAANKGIVHLHSQGDSLSGSTLRINDRELKHFGTCGYLGLEQDSRLKAGVIDAVTKYGTQFPMSKTYVSSPLYAELENLIEEMYGYPVILTKNSTLGHITVIPSIIRDDDVVILDQQVHASIQSAVQMLKPKGVRVEIIRHSNLEMLEERIQELRSKYNRIWYMADGVYSMYGDVAPIKEMQKLADKYDQLYLYVDDAHGMSWAGEHGTGFIMSQVKMHSKMVLCATMGKCFGATGGLIVFPEEEMRRKVKIFGGPLTFSVQIEPPMLGAAIASAKIHLSDEIYTMQQRLAGKIEFCNELIRQTDLPLVVENECPIFFIGTGMPATGYNFVERLMKEGYYVNLGVFPAVPVKNTGVRFTISCHNSEADIEGFVEAMDYHYPKALEDEGKTENEVRKSFKMPLLSEKVAVEPKASSELTTEMSTTIEAFPEEEWNRLISKNMSVDWKGMKFIEEAFSGNDLPEENWKFHYLMVRDGHGTPVLTTFFSSALCKDDIFAQAGVSIQLEEDRKYNPYLLTSQTLVMGSLMTEGNHFYLNKEHSQWEEAVRIMIGKVSEIQESEKISATYLRDFDDNDPQLKEVFHDQGFVKVDVPDSCVIDKLGWKNTDEFLEGLSTRSRRHIRYDVLKYEHMFDVEVVNAPSKDDMRHFQNLFRNVRNRNFAINVFDYPDKFFQMMPGEAGWEFVVLRLKPEFDSNQKPVAVAFNYRNDAGVYTFLLIGMDYEYLEKYNIYRQTIYRTLQQANTLGYQTLRLGISATIEKKKFGANVHPKVAFVQIKDNFNMEQIEQLAVSQA